MNELPDDLVLRVADGVAIDWDQAIDEVGGSAELAALRLIETIAAVHVGKLEPDASS